MVSTSNPLVEFHKQRGTGTGKCKLCGLPIALRLIVDEALGHPTIPASADSTAQWLKANYSFSVGASSIKRHRKHMRKGS